MYNNTKLACLKMDGCGKGRDMEARSNRALVK